MSRPGGSVTPKVAFVDLTDATINPKTSDDNVASASVDKKQSGFSLRKLPIPPAINIAATSTPLQKAIIATPSSSVQQNTGVSSPSVQTLAFSSSSPSTPTTPLTATNGGNPCRITVTVRMRPPNVNERACRLLSVNPVESIVTVHTFIQQSDNNRDSQSSPSSANSGSTSNTPTAANTPHNNNPYFSTTTAGHNNNNGSPTPTSTTGNTFTTTEKHYRFDHVFGPSASQEMVYNAMGAPLIADIPKGINACIIAYGQTGAGKTYTLSELARPSRSKSSSSNALIGMSPDAGVIPRAIRDLFLLIDQDKHIYDYTVKLSYLQIYMETIQDLLKPENNNLQVREDKNGIYVAGLSEHRVRNINDVLLLLEYGSRSKAVAQTTLNRQSSRSHTVFTVVVEKRDKKEASPEPQTPTATTPMNRILRAKFTCVDLAGSERAHKSNARGVQFEEAKSINLSLSALGNVIAALADGKKNTFIPWRDSKLTRLLQDTLGGNSRTSLIINIGPDESNHQESVTSLLFGQRAMNVSVNPKVNEQIDYKSLAIDLQKKLDSMYDNRHNEMGDILARNETLVSEINTLQSELEHTKMLYLDSLREREKYQSIVKELTERNAELEALLRESEERVERLDKMIVTLENNQIKIIRNNPNSSKLPAALLMSPLDDESSEFELSTITTTPSNELHGSRQRSSIITNTEDNNNYRNVNTPNMTRIPYNINTPSANVSTPRQYDNIDVISFKKRLLLLQETAIERNNEVEMLKKKLAHANNKNEVLTEKLRALEEQWATRFAEATKHHSLENEKKEKMLQQVKADLREKDEWSASVVQGFNRLARLTQVLQNHRFILPHTSDFIISSNTPNGSDKTESFSCDNDNLSTTAKAPSKLPTLNIACVERSMSQLVNQLFEREKAIELVYQKLRITALELKANEMNAPVLAHVDTAMLDEYSDQLKTPMLRTSASDILNPEAFMSECLHGLRIKPWKQWRAFFHELRDVAQEHRAMTDYYKFIPASPSGYAAEKHRSLFAEYNNSNNNNNNTSTVFEQDEYQVSTAPSPTNTPHGVSPLMHSAVHNRSRAASLTISTSAPTIPSIALADELAGLATRYKRLDEQIEELTKLINEKDYKIEHYRKENREIKLRNQVLQRELRLAMDEQRQLQKKIVDQQQLKQQYNYNKQPQQSHRNAQTSPMKPRNETNSPSSAHSISMQQRQQQQQRIEQRLKEGNISEGAFNKDHASSTGSEYAESDYFDDHNTIQQVAKTPTSPQEQQQQQQQQPLPQIQPQHIEQDRIHEDEPQHEEEEDEQQNQVHATSADGAAVTAVTAHSTDDNAQSTLEPEKHISRPKYQEQNHQQQETDRSNNTRDNDSTDNNVNVRSRDASNELTAPTLPAITLVAPIVVSLPQQPARQPSATHANASSPRSQGIPASPITHGCNLQHPELEQRTPRPISPPRSNQISHFLPQQPQQQQQQQSQSSLPSKKTAAATPSPSTIVLALNPNYSDTIMTMTSFEADEVNESAIREKALEIRRLEEERQRMRLEYEKLISCSPPSALKVSTPVANPRAAAVAATVQITATSPSSPLSTVPTSATSLTNATSGVEVTTAVPVELTSPNAQEEPSINFETADDNSFISAATSTDYIADQSHLSILTDEEAQQLQQERQKEFDQQQQQLLFVQQVLQQQLIRSTNPFEGYTDDNVQDLHLTLPVDSNNSITVVAQDGKEENGAAKLAHADESREERQE